MCIGRSLEFRYEKITGKKIMLIKRKVFDIIDDKKVKGSKINKCFEIFIISLIVLSIIEIILESYESVSFKYQSQLRFFEFLAITVFSIEYLLRLWTADLKYPSEGKVSSRFKFVTSVMGIIDLLALLPFFLPLIFKFDLRFIRILRVFRLFRIFKLNRYSKAFNLLGSICREKKNEIFVTLFINAILILIASTIMYNLENEIQPDKFPNIVETFWWAIATLTTVGYGDVFPVTSLGKIMSGIIATLGIGLVALPTGIISAGFVEKIQESKKEKLADFKYCPHCGKEIINHEKD